MRNLTHYFRPETAAEAVRLKREYGDRAAYLAGASDLLVHRPERLIAAIDICHAGLAEVARRNGDAAIGGAAALRDVEAALPEVAGGMLRRAVRETAPWLIRNVATLAGNVANASPAADSVPALLALDAELLLLGEREETVPLAGMLAGPHRTHLGDRLITAIQIRGEALARRGTFIKLSRSKSDIAQVNLAVALREDHGRLRDVRIALGAVAPTAVRARTAEAVLEGQEPAARLLDDVAEAVQADISPISDWRASAEYRRRMAGVLLRRALGSLLEQRAQEETQ